MIDYYLELLNKAQSELTTAEKTYLDIFPVVAIVIVLFVVAAIVIVTKVLIERHQYEKRRKERRNRGQNTTKRPSDRGAESDQ